MNPFQIVMSDQTDANRDRTRNLHIMRSVFLMLILLLQFRAFAQESVITTFILVRHAEKASNDRDPELSEAGASRAQKLANLLTKTNVVALYSTKFKRTQNTIRPLAELKNIEITNYDKLDEAALAEMSSRYRGNTILIAGHSNTIPQIANTLLGRNEYGNFPDDDYSNILIVSVTEIGRVASSINLSY